MSDPDRKTTGRGFGIYDEFTDTYGSQVKIQESSSAEGPRVWIFASHAQVDQYLSQGERDDLALLGFRNLDELAAKLSPTPHLDVAQARRVIAALTAFITEQDG